MSHGQRSNRIRDTSDNDKSGNLRLVVFNFQMIKSRMLQHVMNKSLQHSLLFLVGMDKQSDGMDKQDRVA